MDNLGKGFAQYFKTGNQETQTVESNEQNNSVEETTTENESESNDNIDASDSSNDSNNNTNVVSESTENESTVTTEEVENEQSTTENTPTTLSIDDDSVLEYIKTKHGKEISSIDDLFKEPQATENPLDGVSEDVKGFLKYNKDTGRSYEEYKSLDKDYSNVSSLELAREKAILNSKGQLKSISEVDEYLEKKLGIDLSDTDSLEKFDKIELDSYAEDYRKDQIKQQETYKTPAQKEQGADMVSLENGTKMPKAQYEQMLDIRNQYTESVKASADKITSASFDIKIDDNGEQKNLNVVYDYSKNDVHKMTSNALDIDKAFENLFGTEQGIDHKSLQEGLFWADPKSRGKAIQAVVHKALAQQAEDFLKSQNNVSFENKRIPNNSSANRNVPLTKNNQFGVKFDINSFKK